MVGVRIREEKNLKLYRKGQNPVLRGLANIRGARGAHLWTRGWTPRIQTYPGREVPNPLIIDINKGEADIAVVLKDILALTKLNYNTCIFGDGMPITLKFADAVEPVSLQNSQPFCVTWDGSKKRISSNRSAKPLPAPAMVVHPPDHNF